MAKLISISELKKYKTKLFIDCTLRGTSEHVTISISNKEFYNYCSQRNISAVAIAEVKQDNKILAISILGK